MRYSLDRSVRRYENGRVLVGGSPLRMLRLSSNGADLVDRLAAGEAVPVDGSSASGRLVDRLLDAGIVHPVPVPGAGPFSPADVTVVLPVRDRSVVEVLASIGPVGRVVVVDDGSDTPTSNVDDAVVVRRPRPGGPGAARNTGLALVTTPLVAFVDSDGEATPGWLEPLLAHFADPLVAAVAPRILGPAGLGPRSGAFARYESVRSPLDLGPQPGPIRPGTRVAYVPAAAIVVRTDAARAIAGFDESIHIGEDVDFVWRLGEAGWRLRYEPAAVVRHRHRVEPTEWIGRRIVYGESAAPLDRRHPGNVPPLAVSRWSLAAWAFAAAGAPGLGAAVAAGSVVLLAQRLDRLDDPLGSALRIAGLGTLYAGRLIANAMVRPWWPATLAAAVVSRRARRAAVAAVLVPALLDWRRDRPPLDPVRYVGLRLLDDVAYGLGVWRGAIRERTRGPLRPRFPEVLRRRES